MTKDEALKNIATVNAMNYEYQAWAREALAQPEHCSDCGQKLGDANHIHTCSPQSMHPQLKKMLEDYFDKCFVESATQRTWVGLMRGVRVDGDTVVITVKNGNDAARELCGALIEEMNK